MKRTKQNSTASSAKVREKVKDLAKKKKPASSKASSPSQEVTEKSTPPNPDKPSETLALPVETKPLDGSMKIDHLPFDTQANMIFNPLLGLRQRSVVGSDPKIAVPNAHVVTQK